MTQNVERIHAPSGRAARKDETQACIIQASMELFATRGYEGTSISAIAASVWLRGARA